MIFHTVFTRMNFENLELLNKYLAVTKSILLPSLKSQTELNFTWVVLINPEHEEYLKKELDFPFKAIYGNSGYLEYVASTKPNIQTRHDCDDYMSATYIEKIQSLYRENINRYKCLIIHAQPTLLNYETRTEKSLPKYHDKRCSMFLSLCQSTFKHHVNERKHGQMYEITNSIILLPEGYCKWVIHGNNKSLKKQKPYGK